MKFTTNHTEFFKEWRCGEIRILKDVCSKAFYPYSVQKFNGRTWDAVKSFHTLAEAKNAAEWMLDDLAGERPEI